MLRSYLRGSFLLFFFSDSFFFSRSLLSLAALEGLVFFRGFGFRTASFTRFKKRFVTSSLFLC